ncbi:CHAT domain-containing protein [Lentzea sp. HUAS TT2]|uniref:CHAT domain-containing protein n=1 Tax=Lentzea sp. HUAS TT2 TaxID=3447454 RepID=UPI003F6ED3E0
MTDDEQAIESARRTARRLWQTLQEDPKLVSPASAAANAHLATFGLLMNAPDFLEELRMLVDLLRYGVENCSSYEDQFGMWWLSLAQAHAEIAERTDSLADWEKMAQCARAAADSSYVDDEMAEYSAFGLIGFHARRLQWYFDAGLDETVTQQQVYEAVVAMPEEIAELSARLMKPVYLPVAQAHRAAAHCARWAASESEDSSDLHDCVRLFADNVFQLHHDFPFRVDYLAMFAEMCLEQHWIAPERVPYEHAIAAAEEANLAPETEDDPGLHRLAARLIELSQDRDDPAVNDRIIAHYVACAEEEPQTWDLYGLALYRRAEQNDDADAYLAAVHWFERHVGNQETLDEGSWWSIALISDSYRQVWRLRQQPRHADLAIEHATKALALPLPDLESAQTVHWHRLCVLLDHLSSPDAAKRVAPLPYLDWLWEAEAALDVTATPITPEAALLAGTIGVCWFKAIPTFPEVMGGTPADVRLLYGRLESMLLLAKHIDDTDPELPQQLDMMIEFVRNIQRIAFGDGDADLTHLQKLFAATQSRFGTARYLAGLIGSMVGMKVKALGPVRAARKLLAMTEDMDEDEQREAKAYLAFFDLMELVNLNGKGEEYFTRTERAWRIIDALPDSPSTIMMKHFTEGFRRLAELRNGRTPSPGRPVDQSMLTGPMVAAINMGADIAHAKLTGNGDRLRELCAELAKLMTHPGSVLKDGVNPVQGILGIALTALSDVEPGDRQAVQEAIDCTTDLIEAAPVKHTHDVQTATHALARLLRRRNDRGDRTRARKHGLELLAHATWTVLQQADAGHAVEMAHNATKVADELVSWCLTDDAVDDLVRVVDARRGLVLKAAGTGRAITRFLIDTGHHELARKWAEAGGQDASLIPGSDAAADSWGGLRREVVRVLDEESLALITSPSLPEIREALRQHGSGALVYLLPGNARYGGTAVVVPADAEPYVVPLVGLDVVEDSPVARYQKAYEVWHEAETKTGPESLLWRAELRKICAWAWEVAGKELQAIADKIVLVPVGALGMIPWHAAGHDGRHLVQDVTISYTPSARMFCDVIERDEVMAGTPVLVGNPARNLHAGAIEANGLRDAFYPGGLFLGSLTAMPRAWRPAQDGAGTADDVMRLLAEPLPLLHLASHAVADMREPLRSQVDLASGPLSARALLDISPVDILPLGLVNLACCTTNVSGVDYDEALSLATTFLAIGARTVVGSLWWVPSGRATAHLMYMFYHHLNAGLSAAEALRRAQLWMLDPGRVLPDAMPEELRAMIPADGFSEEQIECWAGFTPLGR